MQVTKTVVFDTALLEHKIEQVILTAMPPNLSKNSVSLAGEFAVLSQLVLRGFDANMTLGNTKSVDILGSDPRSGKMFKIEVKTHFKNTPTKSALFGHCREWVMSEKHEAIIDSNLYYCFVSIQQDTHIFRFFLVPSEVVARYVKEQHELWLSTRTREVAKANTMRMFRIGMGDGDYKISTPLAAEYENNWGLLENL